VQAALARTTATFGQLDYAFNNAGVEQPNLDEAEWDRAVDTNLRGVFLCMKYQLPLLL
jgi:NAD(P)-dependent dehydrogenase (short-subunit alcohol dehydrogenase family)